MTIGIQLNLASLGAQRGLLGTQQAVQRNLERLSTGLRVNRAADDAAGLSISERLKYQVKGLTAAIANGQDAINLVSTAESGIDQSTGILQRIRELAIQSGNDTLTNGDRRYLQDELDQLGAQLTQIAQTTEFNTRPLLDGSIAAASPASDAQAQIKQNVQVGDAAATVPDLTALITGASVAATVASVDVAFSFDLVSYQASDTAPVSTAIEVRSSVEGLLTTIQLDNGSPPPSQVALTLNGATLGTVDLATAPVTLADVGKSALVQITAYRPPVTADRSLTFQLGASEGQFVKAGVQDLRAQALRLEGLSLIGSSDADSRLRSQNLLGVVDAALGDVSRLRAGLGAVQNRIESGLSQLSVARENLTASNARIRDTDYAAETADLLGNQIRLQAGQSVLAQANLLPKAVGLLLG